MLVGLQKEEILWLIVMRLSLKYFHDLQYNMFFLKIFCNFLGFRGNGMPTINQLVRKGRKRIVKKTNTPALMNNPQKRGVALGLYNPRKSRILRYVKWLELGSQMAWRLLLYSGRVTICKSMYFLIEGGRVKDLPGVRYHVVRGTLDTSGVSDRKQAVLGMEQK